MLHLRQKCYDHLQKNQPDFIFSPRDSIAPLPPPPPPSHWVSRGHLQKASLTYWGVLPHFEDAVMCSLSIAPRQTCAWGRGHHHFELWPVGRPGAAEEEGREGWRWMTRTVERGGGGRCLDLSLFFYTLPSFAKPIHTHTHTHTLLILLSGHHQGTHLHCNYCFFSFFGGGGVLYNYLFYLFICLSIYLPIYLFICPFICLFTNLFICLSFYMENVFSSTWNTT